MKSQIRLLGVDDGPFSFNDKYALVVGVVMRGNGYLESVMSTRVYIDGLDSTYALIEMIKGSRYKDQIKATMIDGIALGGFNVIDIEELHKETKVPVITITRDKPDNNKIKIALKKNFADWKKRWDIISKCKLKCIKTRYNPIYIKHIGIEDDEAEEIIRISTIRGVLPEPIRVAHLIASGIVRGESYGKA
jgi:hypothetical protein